jgi:hypothetical protein
MSITEKLKIDRAARDVAKDALDTRLAQVREDLHARSIGGRIADKVTADATEAAIEVADVARSNKPVIVGTLAALIAWISRHRIARLANRLLGRDVFETDEDQQKESDW